MKIAIPMANGQLAMHFGHCAQFELLDIDPVAKKIIQRQVIQAPPHEPGLLPRWLAEKGATMIIAGGMGLRAQGLFAEQNIAVVIGAPAESPEKLVIDYLEGSLQSGQNICDH
jgi:predicted Fe-Mo cluster-binding NifX family protein